MSPRNKFLVSLLVLPILVMLLIPAAATGNCQKCLSQGELTSCVDPQPPEWSGQWADCIVIEYCTQWGGCQKRCSGSWCIVT